MRKYSFAFFKSAVSISAFICCLPVYAAEVSLTTADAAAGEATSFNSAVGWEDGAAPAAGNSYTVALGAEEGMYLPIVASTFAGDSLTIGSDDTAGYLASTTFATWTIPSLILKKGVWRVPTTGNMTKIASITVESTAEDPFVVKLGNNTRTSTGTLYGSEDSVICFSRDDSVTTVSDLSPNFNSYPGKVILDGVKFGSLGTQIRTMFGAASGFAPDRIVLKNGAGFGQSGYANTSYSNAKLGVTVDSTGGALYKQDHANPTISFPIVGGPFTILDSGWFFSGRMAVSELIIKSYSAESPSVTFKNGSTISIDKIVMQGGRNSGNLPRSGTAALWVANATVEKDVSVEMSGLYGKSYLRLSYPASTNFSIALNSNSVLDPNPASSSNSRTVSSVAESITIKDFTNGCGIVKLDFDEANAKLECLTIDGKVSGISAATPLLFQSAIWSATAFTSAQPLLRVRKQELTLTKDMLDISGYSFDDPYKIVDFNIVEDGDYWAAMVGPKDAEIIALVEGDGATAATTSFNGCGERWSDGLAPHLSPYLVGLGTNDTDALHFPSVSAEFAGTELAIGDLSNSITGRADIAIGSTAPTYTLPRFALNKGSLLLRPQSAGQGGSITIKGMIIVNSSTNEPFLFEKIGYGYEQVYLTSLYSDENAAIYFKCKNPAVNNGTQSFRIRPDVVNFKGKMILDNAFLILTLTTLSYPDVVPDAITLMNGAAITSAAYNNSWDTEATKKVGIVIGEGGGGFGVYYRIGSPSINFNSPISGGDFFHCTKGIANCYSSMRLRQVRIYNGTPFAAQAGSSFNVDTFSVFGSASLTFNEGVVFEERESPSQFCVSNATLQVGSALPSDSRLVIGASGVFKINNNGDKCQSVSLGDAVIGTGSTLYFDVDAENTTCDSISANGTGSFFECNRTEKLKVVVNPVDAAYAPTDGRTYAFDLLTIPESAGRIDKADIELIHSAESCIDHLRTVIIRKDGKQTVRLTDRNYGTHFMVK